jgi:hypothetical protein
VTDAAGPDGVEADPFDDMAVLDVTPVEGTLPDVELAVAGTDGDEGDDGPLTDGAVDELDALVTEESAVATSRVPPSPALAAKAAVNPSTMASEAIGVTIVTRRC